MWLVSGGAQKTSDDVASPPFCVLRPPCDQIREQMSRPIPFIQFDAKTKRLTVSDEARKHLSGLKGSIKELYSLKPESNPSSRAMASWARRGEADPLSELRDMRAVGLATGLMIALAGRLSEKGQHLVNARRLSRFN